MTNGLKVFIRKKILYIPTSQNEKPVLLFSAENVSINHVHFI